MSAKKLGGIFVARLRNLQVSITNIYSVSSGLTEDPSALLGLALPIFPRALRMDIIRRTSVLPTVHPFLGHPWFVKDFDRGIA